MEPDEHGLPPTIEMTRRFEEGRNEIALFLRGKGAMLSLDLKEGRTLEPANSVMPFPLRYGRMRRRKEGDRVYQGF